MDVARAPQKKPWRLEPQIFVAFFGGTLALTVIAYLNSRRLGMDARKSNLILALGLAVTALIIVAAPLVVDALSAGDEDSRQRMRYFRLGARAVSLLLFGIVYQIQKSADRLYQFNQNLEQPYGSLWIPGLIAVIGLGFVQAMLTLVAVQVF